MEAIVIFILKKYFNFFKKWVDYLNVDSMEMLWKTNDYFFALVIISDFFNVFYTKSWTIHV